MFVSAGMGEHYRLRLSDISTSLRHGSLFRYSAKRYNDRKCNTKRRKYMTNNTTLVGNLTRDPEIRYTRDGQAAANFGLAVTRRWKSRTSDEWEEATSFFDIVCWRELAENIALSLSKGMRVIVTGRMEQRTWENDEGDRRYKVEVIADEVGPSLRFATAEVLRIDRLEQTGQEADDTIEDDISSSSTTVLHDDMPASSGEGEDKTFGSTKGAARKPRKSSNAMSSDDDSRELEGISK